MDETRAASSRPAVLDVEMRSALEMVGMTPLVELGRVYPGPGRILAKAEFRNPGGSMKDRAALAAVQGARRRGELSPGQPVVEQTSGNMGAGLAVACAVLGHPLVVTISAGNSPARARMMEELGAEVELVAQQTGTPGKVTGADIDAAQRRAREIAVERGGFYVDQFANSDCIRAHEGTTGPELWEQTNGGLEAFVCAVGTGATLIGCTRFLKSRNPAMRCAAVEPARAAILARGEVEDPRHSLQGCGYGLVPEHWDPGLVDLFFGVEDEEARAWQRQLACKEGLYVGMSAAANVAAAASLLRSGELGSDATVATVLCDTGLKYQD